MFATVSARAVPPIGLVFRLLFLAEKLRDEFFRIGGAHAFPQLGAERFVVRRETRALGEFAQLRFVRFRALGEARLLLFGEIQAQRETRDRGVAADLAEGLETAFRLPAARVRGFRRGVGGRVFPRPGGVAARGVPARGARRAFRELVLQRADFRVLRGERLGVSAGEKRRGAPRDDRDEQVGNKNRKHFGFHDGKNDFVSAKVSENRRARDIFLVKTPSESENPRQIFRSSFLVSSAQSVKILNEFSRGKHFGHQHFRRLHRRVRLRGARFRASAQPRSPA